MSILFDDQVALFDDPAYTFDGEPVGGSVSASAAEIAAAVLAALQATTIPVDIKKVNSRTITGTGVPGDSMRVL